MADNAPPDKPNPGDRLKPYHWTKGSSGNPGGRPKGVASLAKEYTGPNGEKVFEVLAEIMNNARNKPRDRTEAGKILLERGFGKPIDIQAHVLAGDTEVADEVRELAKDALLKLAAATAPSKPANVLIDATPVTHEIPSGEKVESPQGDSD